MRFRFFSGLKKSRGWSTGIFQWLSRLFEGRVPIGQLAPSELAPSRRWPLVVYSLILSAALATIIVSPDPNQRTLPRLRTGDIASVSVYSPISAEIEPKQLPANTREELYRKVAPVFDYDENTIPSWLQTWIQCFSDARSKFFSNPSEKISQLQLMDRVGEFVKKETGQSLVASDLLFLTRQRFSKDLEDVFQELTKPLLGRLIAQTDLFPSYYSTGIIVRQINLGLNETLVNDVSRIWSLDHARQLVQHVLASAPKTNRQSMRRMAAIVQYLLIPNLKFNPEMTERRINTALGRRETPLISLKKGQAIVRTGERITDDHVEVAEAIRALLSPAVRVRHFLLVTFVLCIFFALFFQLDLTRKSFLRLSLKNALIFGFTLLFSLGAIKLCHPYLQSWLTPFHLRSGAQYLLPVATGAILLRMLLGREVAHVFCLLLAVTASLVLDKNLYYGLWALIVGATAVQSLGDCKQRTDLYKAGAWCGVIGAALALVFDLTQALGLQSLNFIGMGSRMAFAFFSGLLASIIASTLIPMLESALGFTTNMKLLELSNFNHPLLHNLMMKAPGTYHHSIMVGSLAEIAADRIKANSLLARVSAYYHDIGKMANPLYFVENQSPQYNPHDHLSPAISARILFSHVKNGTRMGREHNLGDSINDIIQQHHGTTLAKFFFDKAKEQHHQSESSISETEFRYPGPRPQTREAAIVMIADACEASTRSISDPTSSKIQGMVHSIITKRFLDKQFHDCDLTLKDLQVIEDCISRTLLSLYHHRIEYPGQKQALEERTQEMSAPKTQSDQGP